VTSVISITSSRHCVKLKVEPTHSVCSGDDGIGVGGLGERLWALIMLGRIAIDCSSEVDEGVKHAERQAPLGEF
jgi:hypothetical protein